jgi:DNA-binding CsgD family transcriptional regulator
MIAAAAGSPAIGRLTGASGAMNLVKGTPLPPDLMEDWSGRARGGRVLLQVAIPDRLSAAPHGRVWQHLFGLTAAEARIATSFGSGLPTQNVAAIVGVSVNTVRTHIARCFSKTGVHSQAALARLLVAVEQLDAER